MTKIEKKIIDFVNDKVIIIAFLVVAFTALMLRSYLYYYESWDYLDYLHLWIEQLRDSGGLRGLREEIGEYNVPYMFFLALLSKTSVNWLDAIKDFSCIFDYVGALAAAAIVSDVRGKKFLSAEGLAGFSAFLLSPVVFVDSAYWAQCDSVYSSLILLCIWFMMREKYAPAMLLYGLAFSFKLQALFFLPVIVVYYFASRKMPAKYMLCIPAVYFVTMLPALIAGRSLKSIIGIYTAQTDIYEYLTMACPNLYCFFKGDFAWVRQAGIFLTVSVLGVGAAMYLYKFRAVTKRSLLMLSIWMVFACNFFLPAMHDRYTYLVCVLSVIWVLISPKDWAFSAIINLTTLLSFSSFLYSKEFIRLEYLAVANLAALCMITLRLFIKSDDLMPEKKPETAE